MIPFAFGYSVLRYRLMDVELVVRRVFVYALTTLAIALLIGVRCLHRWSLCLWLGSEFTSGEITLRVVVAVLAMAAIVMVAAPVKNFLRNRSIASSMASVTICETVCSISAARFRRRPRSIRCSIR